MLNLSLEKAYILFPLIHAFHQTLNRWHSLNSYIIQSNEKLPTPKLGSENLTKFYAEFSANKWTEYFYTHCEIFEKLLPSKKLFALYHDNIIRITAALQRHFEAAAKANAHSLLLFEKRYPTKLTFVSDAPLMLTFVGQGTLLAQKNIALVGSRKANPLVLDKCYSFAKNLSKDHVIISGGAYGCDIAAHLGALDSKQIPTPTIVVFAGGLFRWFPRGNHHIFRKIFENGGVLLSERLWHSVPRPCDFPIRNRIISGMSQQLVIMQAQRRSGALTTARYALDQGRDIYVYQPSRVQHPSYIGSEELIAQGAESFQDISELPL